MGRPRADVSFRWDWAAILLTVLGLNLVGEGLNDALLPGEDP